MWTLSENKNWASLEAAFDWVKDMKAVPQDSRHHAEGNVDIHTRMVLDALTWEKEYRNMAPLLQEILWAAALLHDVEKRSTTVKEPDGSITARGHARKGAMQARQILYRDIVTPFSIRESVVALVQYHGLPLWLLEKPDPVKTLIKASLSVNTQWLTLLTKADVLGRICRDQADLLYRLDCFEEFCKEHDCWGTPRAFEAAHARMHYFTREDAYPDYMPFEMPAMEVTLMSGLPGAGKDSYVRAYCGDLPVISLDELREEMDVSPTDKAGNGRVIQAAKEEARKLLRRQQSFVWNATNTTRQMREQLIELFVTYKASVKIVYVEVPYAQLHRQNKSREAIVPAHVLEKLTTKLEVPALWEAHEVIHHVHG